MSPDCEYTVILSRPNGETTHNYSRPTSSLRVMERELIDLGGGLHAVVTAIETEAEPGRKVGLLRARLPAGH